jgi:hypothetical protein
MPSCLDRNIRLAEKDVRVRFCGSRDITSSDKDLNDATCEDCEYFWAADELPDPAITRRGM